MDNAKIMWDHFPMQFQNSPVLRTLVYSLWEMDPSLSLEDIEEGFWIDTAEGSRLDAIGELLQQSRTLEIPAGGVARLEDEEYRRVLRWKIAVLGGSGTAADIAKALSEIFETQEVLVHDIGNANIEVWARLNIPDSPLQAEPSRWVPKAAGVGLKRLMNVTGPYFAWDDDTDDRARGWPEQYPVDEEGPWIDFYSLL